MKNTNNINITTIIDHLKKHNLNVVTNISDDTYFDKIDSITNATFNDITFFLSKNSTGLLKSTNAKACIISKHNIDILPNNTGYIVVNDVYKAFALTSNLFNKSIESSGVISDKSYIDKDTKLGKNIQIDPFVLIKSGCQIGNNVIIESNSTIGPNVKIDDNTIIKSNCTILHSDIKSAVTIKSGAIIGGTGFGFDPKSKIKVSHIGDVVINKNCNIGSNTTIDRAVFDSTIIYENTFIDNLVQIAHNVVIGKNVIIAAQSGIAGSTRIGDNVVIGGQAGISGHLIIGNNVTIAAKSGVTKNLKDNSIVAGFPAIDIKKWKLSIIKNNKFL